jgi:uncharacterized membrane protein YccC
MTPDEEKLVRARQRARATITGIVLGALAILFFAITIAKLAGPHT